MATKLEKDARRAIEIMEAAGIPKHQGILVLVFNGHHRVAGYLRGNPYNAARALVEFLVQEYPDAERPDWLRRAMSSSRRGAAAVDTGRTSPRGPTR
jgi:hypothetical protein